ncbi:hypothetical protein P3T73_10100 [Kiritimatiellota bacterium B12222]|nr:hypothetical protein P3T73_10100 [Kiritimatiellota bacterium B12222]
MQKLTVITSVLVCLMAQGTALAYLMAPQTYSNMFELADVVVIATPLSTQNSGADLLLEVDQPQEVKDLMITVETKFQIAYVLKGELDAKAIRFFHLNLKDKNEKPLRFGAVGTFFMDFEDDRYRKKSFILFLKKREDGTYSPAWRLMEGSRAIIAVEKDGRL